MVRKTRRAAADKNSAEPRRYNSLKKVAPRNEHQKQYLESIENNIVTIGTGPAGSGKTFLAVFEAVRHLWSKKNTGIKRIVIARPAVEAGEKLGFLPGTLDDKLNPYMRPIYDALFDIVGIEIAYEKIERGYVEIAPLAYMRGRTFQNTFLILDEAQNATLEQLKMVLTRIGENCKLVVDGDPSQSDLPSHKKSGFSVMEKILTNVREVGVVKFDQNDIVRSKVVVDIVSAFEGHERKNEGSTG